jgi:hypothetical protein
VAVDSESRSDDGGPMVGIRPLRRSMFVGVGMNADIHCRNILNT